MVDATTATFSELELLSHELAPHYDALRGLKKTRNLLASPLYPEIRGELERVLGGVERGAHVSSSPRPLEGLRAVAWNIRRGTCFDGILSSLRHDPALAGADLILLGEVDLGMGRSHNKNVAQELAAALGMSYAFGVSYLVLGDDLLENPDKVPNTLALAGAAVLSRMPIRRVENVDLPMLKDKFGSSHKRLGKKRALLVEVELDDGPLVACACHLDSGASPKGRAAQLAALLDRATAAGIPRILVGGDFNSSTYDGSSSFPLFADLAHKLFVTGFGRTIDNYMTPERLYETPLFDTLAAHGLSIEGFNERSTGTFNYDLNDPFTIAKASSYAGSLLTRLLQRRLRPWKGVVSARLDWFAGKGISARAAGVADPRDGEKRAYSDHAAIWTELA